MLRTGAENSKTTPTNSSEYFKLSNSIQLNIFFRKRFDICGFYDSNSQHGGPRERRDAEDDLRVSWEDPALAIK